MSKVVSVKIDDIRPKYNNLKEWQSDPNNVYISTNKIVYIDGETYPKEPSPWDNPYKLSKSTTRDIAMRKYEGYIRNKIYVGKVNLDDLRGKTLGCWCRPEICHGDVLLKLMNEIPPRPPRPPGQPRMFNSLSSESTTSDSERYILVPLNSQNYFYINQNIS